MNKELFVSATPHETKVGITEDDQLAEIYLERENEYTLAGSIYKGRVTRVLPGMQSAFVDIGLERDAFLYVSDFMELEEHDEDVTDIVPAGRGVQDMRPQPAQAYGGQGVEGADVAELTGTPEGASRLEFGGAEEPTDGQPAITAAGSADPSPTAGRDSQERERGGWRGRRRRRAGRRDGRGDGRDRVVEPRVAAPVVESAPEPPPALTRPVEPRRSQQFGPPAGYQPIILPGESISKYRGLTQPPVAPSRPRGDRTFEGRTSEPESQGDAAAPIAATSPDDEPIFAAPVAHEHLEPRDHAQADHEKTVEAAATSVDWNREFARQDAKTAGDVPVALESSVQEISEEEDERGSVPEMPDNAVATSEQVVAFASPGTLEEETIDEEEADTVRYEQASDEGYDEFEEETRAAGQQASESRPHEFSEVRETVEEIHMTSLAESGAVPAEGAAETEEDSEELELEEAQAQGEALLDAEARGAGTVDARAEVRAPAATAGYTQRAPRPRPGFDRRSGGRRGSGGRRFPRREAQEVPKISDLLKEGQEILVQIAKEPIGKKGARITSHIDLPGRFLAYMPTVNY